MKRIISVKLLIFFCSFVNAQTAANLSGLRFKHYQIDKNSYAILEFATNRQVNYIIGGVLPMSGKSYQDICPGTYSIEGNKITIRCVCADREVFPDPLEDSFIYNSKSRKLTSTRYQYTVSSAPSPDLSRKFVIWDQL